MKQKIILGGIITLLLGMTVFPVCAQESDSQTLPQERLLPRLVDEAEVLTVEEEADILEKLDEISERQQFDVVIACVNSLGGESAQDYADDFYDYNGYGFGEEKDGTLLLVSMEEQEWYISTCGYGITAITDAGVSYLSNQFLPEMSDGGYKEAFEIFADTCDELVTQAKEGNPYDIGSEKSKGVSKIWIPGSLLLGFLLAGFPMSVMKKQMKNVRMQTAASGYVREGSQNITRQTDMFLYHTVNRTKKPEKEGGSYTHSSSSGRSHGGGGGRF